MPEIITTEKFKELVEAGRKKGKTPRQILDKLTSLNYQIEGHNVNFHPIERIRKKPEFSSTEMVKNIPESAWEMGKAIWTAVSNPLQTAKGLTSLGRGAMRKVVEGITGEQIPEQPLSAQKFTGTEQDEKLLGEMVNFYKERYGGTDKILETIEQDPVGFTADLATLMGGVGVAGKVTLPGKIGQAVGKVGKASRYLQPDVAAAKVIKKVNEYSGVNKVLRSVSNRFMAKATGLSAAVRGDIKRTIGIKPDEWLSKHGISGTLEDIHKQLDNVNGSTKKIVDDLLASSNKVYKNKSANKFLVELRNSFGKKGTDVVEGVDVITEQTRKRVPILDKSGRPIEPGLQKNILGTETEGKVIGEAGLIERKVVGEIPYKQKEPVFIPMENMSQRMTEGLKEIQTLLDKNKLEGLTLSELNKVKRMGDDILDIFDKSGDVKSQRTAQNLGNLRVEIREFIEKAANKEGISDIRDLNKQTQTSGLIKKEIGKILDVTETRSAIGDQLIFLMGLTGSAATVNVAPLLGAGVVVGGREIARLPKVRSFISTRLRLMTDGDYQKLLRAVETGNKSGKGVASIIRRETKLLTKAFPELRLGGIISEKNKTLKED